ADRVVVAVRLGEEPALQERDPHRFQVPGRGRVRHRLHALTGGRRRPTLGPDRLVGCVAERDPADATSLPEAAGKQRAWPVLRPLEIPRRRGAAGPSGTPGGRGPRGTRGPDMPW